MVEPAAQDFLTDCLFLSLKLNFVPPQEKDIYVLTKCSLPFFVALMVASAGKASAEEKSSYVIAGTSGYGVEDCLGEGGECGQVVADAWCEAHGRGAAVKFGRSDNPGDNATTRPYFITCGN